MILVMLGSAYLLNRVYDYVYLNSEPRNKISLLVKKKEKKADYIFIGSSRVQNHINTKIVEELTGKAALNLGDQGAKVSDYELFIKLLIERKNLPEIIFLQIDYVFNHQNNSKIASSFGIPFISTSEVVRNHFIKHDPHNAFLYHKIPFYKYAVNDFKLGFREFFLNLINRKPALDLDDGFNPLIGNFPNQKASLPNYIVKSNEAFNEIVKLTKENGINLKVFIAPYCKNTENLDYVSKLKTKILNFSDFSQVITNEKYFQNCGHLNVSGANKFTEILVNELILNKP